jgi:hypothetical protein
MIPASTIYRYDRQIDPLYTHESRHLDIKRVSLITLTIGRDLVLDYRHHRGTIYVAQYVIKDRELKSHEASFHRFICSFTLTTTFWFLRAGTNVDTDTDIQYRKQVGTSCFYTDPGQQQLN